ncbi:MAG: mucoidy inhibitor MuiA family protein [Cytophagia bacterium]|nr:mucoidy inhibitor MuiA family protein [Cytophagia bacterium]
MELARTRHLICKFLFMRKLMLIAVFALLQMKGHTQTEQLVESKITHVTVFLNKAQVTREVKTKVGAGRTIVVLTGLTSLLDQQSVQVSGKGEVVIEGISHRQNFLNEFNMPTRLKSLNDSIGILQRQVQLEQSQKEILNKEEQMLLSNQKIGGTQSNLTVAELKGMSDFFRARMTEIVNTRTKHDDKIKKHNERITVLQRQIAEQNEMYSRNTSEIVVALSADAATPVELEVNYIVNNAGWQPVYDLRATNTKSPVQLNYKANVYQSTGEEWSNVKLTLSTANPSEGGLKPELSTWLLDFYYAQPIYGSRGMVMKSKAAAPAMEEREVSMMADQLVMAESVAGFVNTIQTSLNTEFAIGLPYTVSSANKPTMVDIRSYEMKATYVYSVAPKLDKDAFLLAKAVGWEDFSLLPGEANIFFEGTFVSTSFIDPNSIKDTLAISLGRDKRVVVKREKLKDFSSRKTIGSNQRDTYTFEISVRNTKSEAIQLIIEDQLPVSMNSQIEITSLDNGGARYNKETGKLTWDVNLQPNETKKFQFKYEVKYPKDKQISGLE